MARRNKKRKWIPKRKEKVVPLFSQKMAIQSECTNWKVELMNGTLIAIGSIQPTGLSPVYKVKLVYKRSLIRPNVTIISPALEQLKGENPPHLFSQQRLCLYYWKYDEWTQGKVIATTIIQWISLWLYYYEIWLVNDGNWMGGGTKHLKNKKTVVENFPLD